MARPTTPTIQQGTAAAATVATAAAAITTTTTSNQYLPLIAGVPDALERIAEFAGIVVGKELRRTRAVGSAIAAIDWAAHDDEPPSYLI